MPFLAALTPAAATLLAGGATAAGVVGSGLIASRAQNRAARVQDEALRRAEAFEREQVAEDKRRYDEQQAALKAQWDAEQERRRPYREAAERIISRYGGRPSTARVTPTEMPAGWTPDTAAKTGRRFTLGTIAGSVPKLRSEPETPALIGPRFSIRNWQDWSNYGA